MWILFLLALVSLAMALALNPSLVGMFERGQQRWEVYAHEMLVQHNSAVELIRDEEMAYYVPAIDDPSDPNYDPRANDQYVTTANVPALYQGSIPAPTNITVVGGAARNMDFYYNQRTGLPGPTTAPVSTETLIVTDPATLETTRYVVSLLPPGSNALFGDDRAAQTAWIEYSDGSVLAGVTETDGADVLIMPLRDTLSHTRPDPTDPTVTQQVLTQPQIALPAEVITAMGSVADGSLVYLTAWTIPDP